MVFPEIYALRAFLEPRNKLLLKGRGKPSPIGHRGGAVWNFPPLQKPGEGVAIMSHWTSPQQSTQLKFPTGTQPAKPSILNQRCVVQAPPEHCDT
jgi:hypothetical protein